MCSDDYAQFISGIKKKTGIDLSMYKEAQMKRRLTSLYEKRGFTSFQEYFMALTRQSELLNEFLDRMTINVSEFYRNRNRWEVLENKILPGLLQRTKRPKIWSAACSTGEEPYTLAMIMSKFMPLSQVAIEASDIDENALARAIIGLYPERSLNEVPLEMRNRFFTKDGNLYKVSPDIKRAVTFRKHNLLEEPFGGPFDLIVCRNVLIYFTEEAKVMLYHKFSWAMKPEAVFFVGSTEQIFNAGVYGFESIDNFFYKKIK